MTNIWLSIMLINTYYGPEAINTHLRDMWWYFTPEFIIHNNEVSPLTLKFGQDYTQT